MAIPPKISRHIDEWVGTFPSAWWIYLGLRFRGYLSPGASGAAVRRAIREAINEGERPRREQLARLRARGLTARQASQFPPEPGARWNIHLPRLLLRDHLLSSKGEEMARWPEEESLRRLPPEVAAEFRRQSK